MVSIARGTRVRFTIGPIGLMRDPDGRKFVEPIAKAGDFGAYFDEHAILDGWHIVTVEVDGETLYAPVDRRQFQIDESAAKREP